MSGAGDAAPFVRERVNPRRPGTAARPVARTRRSPWPWHDPAGRLSPMKLVLLIAGAVPAAWVATAWSFGLLGARPVTEAIHVTGLWSVRFLLLSLLVSPARAVFDWTRVMVVRRQLGLTALFYMLVHLVLFARDQGWVMTHVASEILQRFYLVVGLVALVGLAVLGVTSTGQAQRQLGRAWKRLHRSVYALTVLALFHYFLQSKADVAEATLMAGLFLWMFGWRLLPAGPDRRPLPVLALGVAAAAVTLAVEYAWFALATRIDPVRVLRAEADVAFGLHPAGQVLVVGACVALAAILFQTVRRDGLHRSAVGAAMYAGGGVMVAGLSFAFSLTDNWLPDNWDFWPAAACLVGLAALAGLARGWLPRGRAVMDIAVAACLMVPLVLGAAS